MESERVRLEQIDRATAQAIVSGRQGAGMTTWAHGFPMEPLLEPLRKALRGASGYRFGPWFAYLVVRRQDGLTVGDAGFHGPPAQGEVEVGYAIVPAARGQGLATEAVALLCRWALTQPGVTRIAARVDAGNGESVRVLERLGFTRDGSSGGYDRHVLTG